ncbi:toxin-activating lysine-acyltransferase [Jannaschia sp.]|nr:toxin-activating lysine-acyltransferase [Jannaschia sp.]
MDNINGVGAAPDTDLLRRAAKLRGAVRETFGSVTMAMMALPRYRHMAISDLQHLVLEPLVQDRIALAKKVDDDGPLADITGMAIWASVSEEVDVKIREQIASGTFPVRLRTDEWTSGKINWLLDVIAPDRAATASVIANFKQVAKEGELRLHPVVRRLVDSETLKKMGARQGIGSAASETTEMGS